MQDEPKNNAEVKPRTASRVSVSVLENQQSSANAPASHMVEAHEDKGKKKKHRWLILLLLVVALLCATGAAWWYFNQPTEDMEPNVIVGPMENMTDEELQKLLDEKLAEGMLGFSINTNIVFENAQAEGDILFENPINNAKLTKIEITRDDTGDVVYSTGFLSPGSYVAQDTLDGPLDPGTYKCTAVVSSYREEDKSFIGKAAAEVTVQVK